MARLPINFAEIPSGTDVQGMRRWINEVFLGEPLTAERAKVEIERRRPRQKINKTITSIKCSGSSNDGFGLYIYEPLIDDAGHKPTPRPAIMMLHGGGWIHGTPLGDERTLITLIWVVRYAYQYAAIAEIFASELDAVVIGVDYRLAPEHRFPAPLDDCSDALEWVCIFRNR